MISDGTMYHPPQLIPRKHEQHGQIAKSMFFKNCKQINGDHIMKAHEHIIEANENFPFNGF